MCPPNLYFPFHLACLTRQNILPVYPLFTMLSEIETLIQRSYLRKSKNVGSVGLLRQLSIYSNAYSQGAWVKLLYTPKSLSSLPPSPPTYLLSPSSFTDGSELISSSCIHLLSSFHPLLPHPSVFCRLIRPFLNIKRCDFILRPSGEFLDNLNLIISNADPL